jgi:hypothetical protein
MTLSERNLGSPSPNNRSNIYATNKLLDLLVLVIIPDCENTASTFFDCIREMAPKD